MGLYFLCSKNIGADQLRSLLLQNCKRQFCQDAVLSYTRFVCGTVSSMLSGLKTRSLGLNTLGTT